MENEGRLKLIVAGLVLAAFAVGYFILAQRFQGGSQSASPKASGQSNIVVVSPNPRPSESPTALSQANSGTGNLPGTGAAGVSTLPRTGFPLPIAVSVAASAAVSGWFLRKYSK